MNNKEKNQFNIYKEFWALADTASDLAKTGKYDVDMLIYAWKHQLNALKFFYGTLCKNNTNRMYFSLQTEPKEHQIVYTHLGRGYPKELFDSHWCYVLKHCNSKLLVIPLTSLKPTSGPPVVPFEYDIIEEGGFKARMRLNDMRCIDKMRIIEKKGYLDVDTSRINIEKAVEKFLDFSTKGID